MLREWRKYATMEESLVLAALVLVLGGVWLFVELAEMIGAGTTHALDAALLLALRNPNNLAQSIGPVWLPETMRELSALGSSSVLGLLVLIVIGYLLLVRKPQLAMLVAVAVGGAMVMGLLLKESFGRPRPDLVPYLTEAYLASFPSGHSMMSATTYLTLAVIVARAQRKLYLKIYCVAAALTVMVVVGISRIYLGVHWPTDVLGGWTAGATWALICWVVAWWLTAKTMAKKAMATENAENTKNTSHAENAE